MKWGRTTTGIWAMFWLVVSLIAAAGANSGY